MNPSQLTQQNTNQQNYFASSDPHQWDLAVGYWRWGGHGTPEGPGDLAVRYNRRCAGGHGILEGPGDLAVGYWRWGVP